jgi:uncharacterized protein (DUF2141 family)
MERKKFMGIKSLFFMLFALSTLGFAGQNLGKIVVKIEGFKNNNGVVHICIFDTSGRKDFPCPNHVVASKKIIISDLRALAEFDSIPYGQYAISMYHDEDGDGKLKTNILGMPVEGIGFSNNVRPKLGPPSFKDAAFYLNSERMELTISVLYL